MPDQKVNPDILPLLKGRQDLKKEMLAWYDEYNKRDDIIVRGALWGMSAHEISLNMGLSANTVGRVFRRNGLELLLIKKRRRKGSGQSSQ